MQNVLNYRFTASHLVQGCRDVNMGNGVPVIGALEIVNLLLVEADQPQRGGRVVSEMVIDTLVDVGVYSTVECHDVPPISPNFLMTLACC